MKMNIEGTYVLNPGYFLRSDVCRAIIGTYDYCESVVPGGYEANYASMIHPLNAQLFSFFDGKRSLRVCVGDISKYFTLPEEVIYSFIEKFIGNTERLLMTYGNQQVWLPKNILVESGNLIRREVYTPHQFSVTEDVDLYTLRLFKPIRAMFELTFKCCTDCTYCYADRLHPCSNDFLSVDKIKEIIRDAKRCGIVDLDINGGEVLMHPYSEEILRELVCNDYHPLVSTKIPLDKETLEMLKLVGINRVQVSLDSVNSVTLTKILKVGHAYRDKILETLQMLDDMEFHWQVNSIVVGANSSIENEILPLIHRLVSYKNIRRIKMGPAGCSLYKTYEHFNAIKIDVKTTMRIKEILDQVATENPHIDIGFSEPDIESHFISSNIKRENFYKRSICTGNTRNFVILPDGKVTICEELYWHPKFIIGDLSQQSIMEMWSSEKAINLFKLQRECLSDNSRCKHCDEFSECRHSKGVCWKMILMAYGKDSWDYPDPRCYRAPMPLNEFYLV
jgi:radical SAM protein with 4Fe4S-binding SPASM domain